MPLLRLAVSSPLRQLFDYLPPSGVSPEDLAALTPGARIRVPFGRRTVTAYLQEVVEETDVAVERLREAQSIIDPVSLLSEEVVALLQWAATYYQHPVGEVFPAAFPAALRKGEAHRPVGRKLWRLTERGLGLPAGALARAPKQALALALLQDRSGADDALFAAQGIKRSILRQLREKQLIEDFIDESSVAEQPDSAVSGPALNDEQHAAVTAVEAADDGFNSFLLEGVTGSGKTEVYLQLIARCLARGQQALVLIPEIGLTPQTLKRFEDRFNTELAVMHSGLPEGQRYRAWEAARSGRASIVLGTRSAVFAPLAKPGLIIVDEEHDGSYKQSDGFRYSARDVAIKRAQRCDVPVVLGSATPSLESIANTESGRYQWLPLSKRATGAAMPSMQAVDVRRAHLQSGFSEPVIQAIEETLAKSHQVLLFLNRRGYAPQLQCHDCGWIAECDHCDARLTLHLRQNRMRCHHCNAARPVPTSCPQCRGKGLMTSGLGTEQVDAFIRQRFPSTAVYRVDRDTVRSREAMSDLVNAVSRGGPCILLGTQMLAKGHHFPQVALVAVLDADAGLFSTDFRGEERMAQLLTQVAGRAGRDGTPGSVLVQTHYPDHPTVHALLHSSYHKHSRELLAARRDAGMPPIAHLALIHADSSAAGAGEDFLARLRESAEPLIADNVQIIGPLPTPLTRRAGKFRHQLLLHSRWRPQLQGSLTVLIGLAEQLATPGDLRWSIDVDPQEAF